MCGLPRLESEDLADETCDAHFIEQTDKGYRCAIDVPSVLYKWVIYSAQVAWSVSVFQVNSSQVFFI